VQDELRHHKKGGREPTNIAIAFTRYLLTHPITLHCQKNRETRERRREEERERKKEREMDEKKRRKGESESESERAKCTVTHSVFAV
jgi:hypothetical protein